MSGYRAEDGALYDAAGGVVVTGPQKYLETMARLLNEHPEMAADLAVAMRHLARKYGGHALFRAGPALGGDA